MYIQDGGVDVAEHELVRKLVVIVLGFELEFRVKV